MNTNDKKDEKKAVELLIEKYYHCFNKGDIEGMMSCLHADFIHDVNEGKRKGGHDTFRNFLNHMNECYKEELKDMYIMVHNNCSRASCEFVVHGEYLKTDGALPPAKHQKYVIPAGTFFEIKDGKILRVTTYYNLNNWIEQVSV